jgi:lipopolysaccharide transport system ATP-binding protein
MSIIIEADRLSKRFQILGSQSGYKTIRETLSEAVKKPFRSVANVFQPNRTTQNGQKEEVWALQDLSFQVHAGEVLGIIGKNGAGKSTLLKIISRITYPTQGTLDVYGRVGSLLEVGTGFHPELSGRENLYLSGAILGMKRREIDRKMEEIVEFAEIGKYLDTPVKHYSSGMYLRLAFSVAAHLEPHILLVDEVLAVGDIAFQQKCLNHMRGLTKSGMTILLVSHNMASIQSSCHRALLLDQGKLVMDGNPTAVIEKHKELIQAEKSKRVIEHDLREDKGVDPVEIISFEMRNQDGHLERDFRFGERIKIKIVLHASKRIENPMINFGILRGDGVVACNFNNWYDNFKIDAIEGDCSLEGWLPPLRLIPDFYEAHVLVWPWGGGHLHGDMAGSRPLAWSTFGHFRITGPGLNAHDGVFQVPSEKWIFTSPKQRLEYRPEEDHTLEKILPADRF